MRSFRVLVALMGLLAGMSAALAADDRWCSGVSEDAETSAIRIGRVTGKSTRVNFISNPGDTEKTQDCPSASAECRRTAFVVPGDNVLVDAVTGDFACVSYLSPGAVESGGWLPVASLELAAAVATPGLPEWVGSWKRVEAGISLKLVNSEIQANGQATYGAADRNRVKSGAVNTGAFSGVAKAQGNMLAFGGNYDGGAPPGDIADDCNVRLRLFGRYLVAQDNRRCGGVNVSFSGVYVRTGK